MIFWSFLGLLLLQEINFSQGIPDIQIKENSTVDLPCKFKATSANGCLWMKDSTWISVESFPDIFVVYGKKEEADCSMKILKANITIAEGIWRCVLPISPELLTGETIEVAKVTILVHPKSLSMRYSRNQPPFENNTLVQIKEGTQAVICNTRFSNPPTNITWFIDGIELEGENITSKEQDNKTWNTTSILHFNFTKNHDKMILTCLSSYQRMKNKTYIVLNILYKTTYVRVLSGDLVTARKGHKVAFQCEADGNPPPKYQWFHKRNSTWTLISKEEIILLEASGATEGHYLCMAGNDLREIHPAPEIQLQVVDFENSSLAAPILAGSISSVLAAIIIVGIFIFYFRRKKIKEITHQIPSRQSFIRHREPLPQATESTNRVESKLHTDRDGYLVTRDLNKYISPDPVTPPNLSTPQSVKDSPIYWEPHVYENVWKTNETIELGHHNKEYLA